MAELIEMSSLGADEIQLQRRRTPLSVKRDLLAGLVRSMDDGPLTGAARRSADERVPYFFLSCGGRAAGSRSALDAEIRPFFRLLCTYVGQLAADVVSDECTRPPAVIPGFLAGDPSAGSAGGPRLLNALSSCRVFVPLLTARYFDSAACHREWETFRRRDEMRRRRHPFGLSAVVPVLWEGLPDLDLPAWAADMELADTTVGREYLDRGIRALLVENRPACRKVVFRIARRIHHVAECLSAADEPGFDVLR